MILGAGIVGLTVARELAVRGFKNIAIFEKEKSLGVHSSGQNSGVIHAGLYYEPSSLKAAFCREGAKALVEYAMEQNIPHNINGKVIVTKNQFEEAQLEKLYLRALQNQVQVELLDQKQLYEVEPRARTFSKAIYSPKTGLIDSKTTLQKLRDDLCRRAVSIHFSQKIQEINWEDKSIKSSSENVSYGHLINCAGMFADQIAHSAGVAKNLKVLPFKGSYRKLRSDRSAPRLSIYPVPDPKLPFLGVHVTPTLSGEVLLGPTAFPSFVREKTSAVGFESVRLVAYLLLMVFQKKNNMASHLKEEIGRWSSRGFLSELEKVMDEVRGHEVSEIEKVGLRPQLIDLDQGGRLVMDFVVKKAEGSTHVLNTVSPGFTSSFSFAKYICDQALN